MKHGYSPVGVYDQRMSSFVALNSTDVGWSSFELYNVFYLTNDARDVTDYWIDNLRKCRFLLTYYVTSAANEIRHIPNTG